MVVRRQRVIWTFQDSPSCGHRDRCLSCDMKIIAHAFSFLHKKKSNELKAIIQLWKREIFGNALYQLFRHFFFVVTSTQLSVVGERANRWMSPCWLTLREWDLIAAAMPFYHLTFPKLLPTVPILIFMVFISSSVTIILTRTWQHNSALPQFQCNP